MTERCFAKVLLAILSLPSKAKQALCIKIVLLHLWALVAPTHNRQRMVLLICHKILRLPLSWVSWLEECHLGNRVMRQATVHTFFRFLFARGFLVLCLICEKGQL